MNDAPPTNCNIAILGSTNGTNLKPLCQSLEQKSLPASISLVISNSDSAGILTQAQAINLPAMVIPHHGLTRLQHEYHIHQALKTAKIDLVILLGYMRIFTLFFIRKWQKKLINVHPSLLPKHKGLMDLSVHQAVIDAKETESGCSVHYVTEKIDNGKIITQKKCPIKPNLCAHELKKIIQPLEVIALSETIAELIKEPVHHEFIS